MEKWCGWVGCENFVIIKDGDYPRMWKTRLVSCCLSSVSYFLCLVKSHQELVCAVTKTNKKNRQACRCPHTPSCLNLCKAHVTYVRWHYQASIYCVNYFVVESWQFTCSASHDRNKQNTRKFFFPLLGCHSLLCHFYNCSSSFSTSLYITLVSIPIVLAISLSELSCQLWVRIMVSIPLTDPYIVILSLTKSSTASKK